MNDAEKIEALREWAGQDFPDEWASGASGRGEYWRGYFAAAKMVRDIIDPPILCDCGQEDVRGSTVERAGVKHSETWCERCCPHGGFVSEVCEECNPPKPKWRQMADAIGPAEPPLHITLWHLAEIANDRNLKNHLAGIIAVAEAQVGDGWQANPERVHPGFWGVAWLLVPLSHEPPDWAVVADRAAAWLRSLTDGGAA